MKEFIMQLMLVPPNRIMELVNLKYATCKECSRQLKAQGEEPEQNHYKN
jgi:predicted transcriptional regulator